MRKIYFITIAILLLLTSYSNISNKQNEDWQNETNQPTKENIQQSSKPDITINTPIVLSRNKKLFSISATRGK